MSKESLTLRIFGLCVAALFYEVGVNKLNLESKGFHEKLAQSFKAISPRLEEIYEVEFFIEPHHIHGLSGNIKEMFLNLLSYRLAHYKLPSDGYFYLDMDKPAIREILKDYKPEVVSLFREMVTDCIRKSELF